MSVEPVPTAKRDTATRLAYERTDPALDGVTRLFFREVVVHDRP